jgi:hypothetical protein
VKDAETMRGTIDVMKMEGGSRIHNEEQSIN